MQLFKRTWESFDLEKATLGDLRYVMSALGVTTARKTKESTLSAIREHITSDPDFTEETSKAAYAKYKRSTTGASEPLEPSISATSTTTTAETSGSTQASTNTAGGSTKRKTPPSNRTSAIRGGGNRVDSRDDDESEDVNVVDVDDDSTARDSRLLEERSIWDLKIDTGMIGEDDVPHVPPAVRQRDTRDAIMVTYDSESFPILSDFGDCIPTDIFAVDGSMTAPDFAEEDKYVPQVPGFYFDPRIVNVDLDDKAAGKRERELYNLQRALRNAQQFFLRAVTVANIGVHEFDGRHVFNEEIKSAFHWLSHIGGQLSFLRQENIMRAKGGKQAVKEVKAIADRIRRNVPADDLFDTTFQESVKKKRKFEANIVPKNRKGFFRQGRGRGRGNSYRGNQYRGNSFRGSYRGSRGGFSRGRGGQRGGWNGNQKPFTEAHQKA